MPHHPVEDIDHRQQILEPVSAPLEARDEGSPLSAALADPRFWIATFAATGVVAVLLAIPTAIIDNPWFTRMTPVGGDQYFFWFATSLLTGALVATFVLPSIPGRRGAGSGVGAGVLGTLAIGCPICNKVVVALLGVSGAFTYFAPIQPILGAAGLLLVATALTVRLRGLRADSCRVPDPA